MTVPLREGWHRNQSKAKLPACPAREVLLPGRLHGPMRRRPAAVSLGGCGAKEEWHHHASGQGDGRDVAVGQNKVLKMEPS